MIEIINNSSKHMNDDDISSLLGKIMKLYQVSPKEDVEIVFVNKDTIKKYNKEFRNTDKATNVLSFPAIKNEKEIQKHVFGTIMICPDYIQDIDNNTDINKYIIHGFLHLLGYDHDSDENAKQFYKEYNFIAKKLKLKEVY